jgi:dUTP pyrophosphatase
MPFSLRSLFGGDKTGAQEIAPVAQAEKPVVRIELSEQARKHTRPGYATIGAAGFDVRSEHQAVIPPHSRMRIPTGIRIAVPEGYVIFACSRSGLADREGVFVLNAPGIVDEDYRGMVDVILLNTSDKPFRIDAGDRICQLVVQKAYQAEIVEAPIDPNETARGAQGFGHTGKR